jgi:hypothetical protein
MESHTLMVTGDGDWPMPFLIFPLTSSSSSCPFVPDTPRWYYIVGKEKTACETFAKLQGDNDGILSEENEREWAEIKAAIDYDPQNGSSHWKNLFSDRATRYRTYVALFSQFIWA